MVNLPFLKKKAAEEYIRKLEEELEKPAPIDRAVQEMALKAAAAKGRSITAAVSMVEMDGASWKSYRFGDRAWQSDIWRLYDITGQLRFVSNWAGGALSRCILRVHEVDDQGNTGAIVDDPEIAQLGSGPLGIGDSRAEALRLAGICLFVCGEAFLIAESGGAPDGGDLWWVVTSRQIKRQGDVITVVRSPMHGGGTFAYRDGVDLILRCWTPHPADTNEPDSSARSAIPDLRKMEAIRKREFAELDSRLAGAGILLLPDTLDLPRADTDPEGVDGFAQYMMRAMSTSLRDRSSAAAMVPIILQGNADDLDKVKHVTFWSPLSEQLQPMWQSTLASLGQDLDIPPEVMAGLGSSNHWSAWIISDSAINEQIKPLAARVASALTIGYLWPALEALGVEEPTRYTYQFDATLLTVRPNRSSDAITYHSAGLISDKTTRAAGAWGEEDAPDLPERARRLAEQLLISAPQVALADPGIREILGIPGGSLSVPADDQGAGPSGGVPEIEENTAPDTLPSGTDARPDDQQTTPPEASSGFDVAVALLARRAMKLAGQKLVPHRERHRYRGVPGYQLAAQYGPVSADRINDLIANAWDDLPLVCDAYGLDQVQLSSFLAEFCRGLLVRGKPYCDRILFDLLARPEVVFRITSRQTKMAP